MQSNLPFVLRDTRCLRLLIFTTEESAYEEFPEGAWYGVGPYCLLHTFSYLRYPQFPYDVLIWLCIIQGSSFNPTTSAWGIILYHGNRPD